MNRERLLMLADFLRTVPEENFDLTSWRYDNTAETVDVGDNQLSSLHCGTTGCAVGWACSLPEFNAQGLTWRGSLPLYSLGDSISTAGWEAVEGFFYLGENQSLYLFSDKCYSDADDQSPAGVAKRIEDFVYYGK